jgi:hypothetical protein
VNDVSGAVTTLNDPSPLSGQNAASQGVDAAMILVSIEDVSCTGGGGAFCVTDNINSHTMVIYAFFQCLSF